MVVSLLVWQQGFLQPWEEKLESISMPSLCLFSKFVAVVLLERGLWAGLPCPCAEANGHREQAALTICGWGHSKQRGRSAMGRVWELRGPGLSSLQCCSRGTEHPILLLA